MQAEQGPALIRLALSPGRPLSSLLTEDEEAQLRRALARTSAPEQLGMALEQMKPWFATLTLGVAPLTAAGYEADAGADVVLAGIARAQGAAILGFETVEQQLAFFAGDAEDEQLTALRDFLGVDDETFAATSRSATLRSARGCAARRRRSKPSSETGERARMRSARRCATTSWSRTETKIGRARSKSCSRARAWHSSPSVRGI